MKIIIDTSRHCIETGSKKKYEHLLRQYFKSGCIEKQSIEYQIQALKYFLENADFSDLRNQYPSDATAEPLSTLIFPENIKQMYIQLKDKILYPAWIEK